jgi:peptide-methionine (S)-S-oxide reductase
MSDRTIYLAGGCFWGLGELFRQQKGVTNTEVGYTGGSNDSPSYENHDSHAETLAVSFNDNKTSYKQLLDFFFRVHDPTTKDRQGNDIGKSYRSAIFYQSEEERSQALEVIAEVDKSGLYPNAVVTTLEKYDKFWSAEDYHQDYLQKNPGGYTCHYIRSETPILRLASK